MRIFNKDVSINDFSHGFARNYWCRFKFAFDGCFNQKTLIENNSILNSLFNISIKYGVENEQQFLFILGILVFIMLVISLSFK